MGIIAQRVYTTGMLEKRDPLPLGRYWLDVYDFDTWNEWLAAHGKPLIVPDLGINVPQSVIVDKTTDIPADEANGYPEGSWVLFRVVDHPTPWGNDMAKKLGWPDIAGPEIQGIEDTVQRPPPEANPLDNLTASKLGWIPWVVGGGVAVVGLVALAKLVRG